MKTIGVCGSDVHYYETGRIGAQVVTYPYKVGHECSGVVEEVGAGVKKLRKGDRVAVDPAAPCGTCDQCRVGRHHTCRNLRFLGTPGQADGCLCEYIVMPEGSCFPIPDSVTFDQAAIVEPLSIGLYAANFAGPVEDAKLAILGSGPIGLSVLLPLKAKGAPFVCVTDKIDKRLDVARTMGASLTANPTTEDVVARVLEKEPLGLDAVVECCGEQEALDQALEMLKPGGKLIVVGIPRVDRISLSVDRMRRQEICVQNIRRQVDCVQPAIDLIADGKVSVDPMVTHRFPFEKAKDAFDLVAGYRDGVVKAMIDM